MLENSEVGRGHVVNGVPFTVLEVKTYPKEMVSKRYAEILNFRQGTLVAISFRGTLIPNIVFDDGVVRLTEVAVDGQVYSRPKAICQALKVTEAMYAYDLKNGW